MHLIVRLALRALWRRKAFLLNPYRIQPMTPLAGLRTSANARGSSIRQKQNRQDAWCACRQGLEHRAPARCSLGCRIRGSTALISSIRVFGLEVMEWNLAFPPCSKMSIGAECYRTHRAHRRLTFQSAPHLYMV